MAKIGEAHVKIVPYIGDPQNRATLCVYEPKLDAYTKEHYGDFAAAHKELAQAIEEYVDGVTMVIPEQYLDPEERRWYRYRFHVYFTSTNFPAGDIGNVLFYIHRMKVAERNLEEAEFESTRTKTTIDSWKKSLEKMRKTDGA